MVQESFPPATTDGYAILLAPLALHSYSARHRYNIAELLGRDQYCREKHDNAMNMPRKMPCGQV